MSPAAETVIGRLEAIRHKWWLFSLLSTCVLAACTSLGVWLVFVFGDAFLRCSQGILTALFLAWLTVTAAALWIVGRRLMLNQRGLEATARRVETEYPDLGNDLINLVQLAEDRFNGDPAFCETAIRHAATESGRVSFDAAAARHTRWERLRYRMQTPRDLIESLIFLGILIVVAAVCRQYIPNWGSAAVRLFSPWEFVPAVGKVGAIEVSPKDVEILVGGSQEIVAEIKNPQAASYAACIYVQPEGETESAQPLMGDEKHRLYKYTQSSVLKPVKYRVEIGDSQTPIYTIKVLEKPTVADVTVVYRYPAYLNRKEQAVQQKTADLDAPQYTVAELKIRPTTPIAKGHIQLEGKQYRRPGGRKRPVVDCGNTAVEKRQFYDSSFQQGGSHRSQPANKSHTGRARQAADRGAAQAASQGTSAPGSTVPVTIRAGDDYGIGRLRLEMKIQRKDSISGSADAPVSG